MASSTPTTQSAAPGKRRRRRIVLLLLPLLLLVGGWQVVKQFIDIERYRPIIDKELELLIELPLEFGAMDLRLFPTPRLVVNDVTLGEPGFMVTAPQVSVTAHLGALLQRRLDLRTVLIEEARIQLPASAADFGERWSDYMLDLNTPDPTTGKPMLKVTLAEIAAPEITIYRGDWRYGEAALTVSEVTEGAPEFVFTATVVGIAGTPELEGALTLTVNEEPLLAGVASVSGLPLAEITDDRRLPDFRLDGDLEYSFSQDDRLTWTAAGDIYAPSRPAPLGTFALASTYEGGTLDITTLEIDTPPVVAEAALTLASDAAWALHVDRASLEGEGVDWVLAFVPELPLRAGSDGMARGALETLRLGVDEGGEFFLDSGVVRTDGVDLLLDGPDFAVSGLRSHVAISPGRYEIRDLSGDFLNLSGTLVESDGGTMQLDLTGQLYLGPTVPLLPAWQEWLKLEGGTVEVLRCTTTLLDGQPLLSATFLDTELRDGAIALWNRDRQEFTPLDHIGGYISLEDSALCLNRLVALGSEVTAEVQWDEHFDNWTFAAAFRSELISPIWRPFYPDTHVAVSNGTLNCPQVSGRFSRSDGEVHDLRVDGQVTGLDLGLSFAHYVDAVHIDSVALSAAENRVTYALKGQSDTLGPLQAKGDYAPDKGLLKGEVVLQVAKAARALGVETAENPSLDNILKRLDRVTLQAQYTRESRQLSFSSETPLAFSGTVGLTEATKLAAVRAVATVPMGLVPEWIPEGVTATGDVGVDLHYEPSRDAMDIALDFTPVTAAWEVITKPSGFPAIVEISGSLADGNNDLSTGTLQLGGTRTPFYLGSEGVGSDAVSLNLVELAGLFPAGAALGGTVNGGFEANGARATLDAVNVLVKLGESVPPLGLHGPVKWNGRHGAVEGLDLSYRGHVTRVILDNGSDGWSGSLTGGALELDQITADYAAWNSWWAGDEGVAPKEDTPSFTIGTIDVALDTLGWGDAVVSDVRGVLTQAGDDTTFSNLQFKSGDGRGTGTVVWQGGDGAGKTDRIDLDLVLMSIDLGLIESLLSESTRDMRGAVDGRAVLSIPLYEDDTPSLNGMDGTVSFSARNGTLGKAGLASKFLTALRTTDILRLRIPSLRDKGVTFTALAGDLSIESGVFHLSPYHMEDSTYVIDAEAILDFPKDTAEGHIDLQILEGVTGVASNIPLLGDAAEMMNKAFGVELRLGGAATDPTFRAGKLGPLKSLESGARSLLRGTQRLVGQ